ncbi:YdcF family protein [Ruminococcus sp. NK3A76]|uniref:YdcF family protein n=1 Tax=Ruminococcus sp. NK3A76 TaxID=877411 RepID=UPI00069060F6|nr:YdcF family protein [Ruminococcus sp. NK3A76]
MEKEVDLTKMVIRFVIAVLESVLLWSFLRALPVVCAGNVAGIAVSSALILVTVFFDKFKAIVGALFKTPGGKVIVIFVSLVIIAAVVYCSVLSVLMYKAIKDGEHCKADAVIVLGCQIKGDRPSRMLAHRLDKAYDYLTENEDCVCIVSGGKGWDEDYSEAEVMKNYLVEKGIDESRIIEEGKSTSTKENMDFSYALLKERGITGNICFVSDGYHIYRAGLIAKNDGIDAFGLAAETELRYLPTYWVREWLTLTYFFVSS